MVIFQPQLLTSLYFIKFIRLNRRLFPVITGVLWLISGLTVYAQEPVQLGKINADCLGAVTIRDSIGPVFSPRGYGNKLEISGYQLGDPMFIEQEHNTVWYKFKVPYDAMFSFDIVPIYAEDDFDFMLFRYDGPAFCQTILDDSAIPVRSNISRKNIEVDGRTGLKEGVVEEYVPSGPGDSYSRALQVKQGEEYYMLIDNPFRENRGHHVYLYFDKMEKNDPRRRDSPEEKKFNALKTTLNIHVRDKETGDPIKAFITIEGTESGQPIELDGNSEQSVQLTSYRAYSVSAVSKGYMLNNKSFMPARDSSYSLDFELNPIKKGIRMTLEDIKFEEDKAVFLEKSLPALRQLQKFMSENPEVSIEVGGHVNGLTKRNKKEYKILSNERAEAVQNYLIEKGTEASRLKVKGYGNAEMLFPDPLNNGQMEANRRVEIKILKD